MSVEESETDETLHTKGPDFIDALSKSGNITLSCERALIARATAYRWRDAHADFKADWDIALAEATDRLEAEARRRAEEGVDQPVWYQGEMVGTEKRYSDTLMIQLLKAHHPAHQQTINHNHRVGGLNDAPPIKVQHSASLEDMAEALRIVQEVSDDARE